MAQWRQIIYMHQVGLGLLHSLHTAVDGSHQGLLGKTLTGTNNRDAWRSHYQTKAIWIHSYETWYGNEICMNHNYPNHIIIVHNGFFFDSRDHK